MSDTIRQSICSNLITRLQDISKANGYSSDYPVIEEWRLSALEPVDFPTITLRDERCEIAQYDPAHSMWRLFVSVFICAKGDESQEDLRNYINDVYTCIGSDLSCGGYGEIQPEGDEMNMEQHEDVYGDIEIKFSILFETSSWNLTRQI